MRKLRLSTVLICALFLLFLGSDLLISTASEQVGGTIFLNDARLKPTPKPPRTVSVRRGGAPNMLRGLSVSPGGGCPTHPCGTEMCGIEVYTGLHSYITNGDFIRSEVMPGARTFLGDLFAQQTISTSQLPMICLAGPVDSGSVTATSPEGKDYEPYVLSLTGNSVVQLPLDAYTHPGYWRLRLGGFEIGIEVPSPYAPFAIRDDQSTDLLNGYGGYCVSNCWNDQVYLIGGFAPFESIVGLAFLEGSFAGDVFVEADENGYALIRLPSFSERLDVFVGEYGNSLVSRAVYGADFRRIGDPDAVALIYEAYWGSGGELASVPGCEGYLMPRLTIGGRGRVLPSDSPNALNSLPKRPSKYPDSQRVGTIPIGSVFTVLEGPVCGDANVVWWRVNYNGIEGWTGEGQGQVYWVEPVP